MVISFKAPTAIPRRDSQNNGRNNPRQWGKYDGPREMAHPGCISREDKRQATSVAAVLINVIVF